MTTEAITDADVERAERYVALLKEAKQLEAELPDSDTMEAVGNYVSNLREIEKLDAPDDDEIREVAAHVENLREIAERES